MAPSDGSAVPQAVADLRLMMSRAPSDFFNDGSEDAPRLETYLNLATLNELPDWSMWPRAEGRAALELLEADGFSGIQGGDPALCRQAGMSSAAMGRVLDAGSVHDLVSRFRDDGYDMATLNVRTGFEDDCEAILLAETVARVAEETAFPLFVEIHRATLTQDFWRTTRLIGLASNLRFNGDFSHYYTGQEMRYGDFGWSSTS